MTENKKYPICGVHVSPGIEETLVRRGKIAHDHSIAYILSNNSAKNHQNLLMHIEVPFFETQCITD